MFEFSVTSFLLVILITILLWGIQYVNKLKRQISVVKHCYLELDSWAFLHAQECLESSRRLISDIRPDLAWKADKYIDNDVRNWQSLLEKEVKFHLDLMSRNSITPPSRGG